MIVARDLVVRLGGTTVLDHLDLELAPGSLVCLVGPNGAGKTTLLRTLAGELPPTSGAVWIDDARPDRRSIPDRARLRAFLAQVDRTDIPFPVRTVVGFGTHVSTLDGPQQVAMVDRSLEQLEITHLADRRVESLSGGERRRVAIARTLAQDASVTLLDEPTDSLDLGHADSVLRLLRALAHTGRTVITSSHDLNLASRHGDRIIVIDGGRVLADGTPAETMTEELLSAVYRCDVHVTRHPRDGRPVVYL